MILGELLGVLRKKPGEFIFWLSANLGGLIIAYIACVTNFIIHGSVSKYIPGYEVFLITGTISLAVSGASYIRLHSNSPELSLSPFLSISWPFPLMGVYGVLISVGAREPARSLFVIWIICILLFLGLMLWSSLIWLHELGIRMEMGKEPEKPEESKILVEAADNLPKLD